MFDLLEQFGGYSLFSLPSSAPVPTLLPPRFEQSTITHPALTLDSPAVSCTDEGEHLLLKEEEERKEKGPAAPCRAGNGAAQCVAVTGVHKTWDESVTLEVKLLLVLLFLCFCPNSKMGSSHTLCL